MPVYRQIGDALVADKVVAKARHVGKLSVVQGSGTDKVRQLALRVSVYCVIARPLRALQKLRKP